MATICKSTASAVQPALVFITALLNSLKTVYMSLVFTPSRKTLDVVKQKVNVVYLRWGHLYIFQPLCDKINQKVRQT